MLKAITTRLFSRIDKPYSITVRKREREILIGLKEIDDAVRLNKIQPSNSPSQFSVVPFHPVSNQRPGVHCSLLLLKDSAFSLTRSPTEVVENPFPSWISNYAGSRLAIEGRLFQAIPIPCVNNISLFWAVKVWNGNWAGSILFHFIFNSCFQT